MDPALDATAGAASPPPEAFQPWLPWLAAGVLIGALLPQAMADAAAAQVGWHALPATLGWAVGVPLAGLALVLVWWRERLAWLARVVAFLAAWQVGAALGACAPVAAPAAVTRLLACRGEVIAVHRQGRGQAFSICADRVALPAGFPPPARLYVRAAALPGVRCGDLVAVRGVWMRDARGPALQAQELEMLRPREVSPRGWAWAALARVAEHRELAEAYLLGQGDPPEKPQFRSSGLLHVLAVSGMHLVIAAVFAAWLLRLAGVGWWPRQLALALLICGYTWLTDASPATMRALVMGLAVLLMGLLARAPHRLAAISLAALVLIAWDPGNATDIGFQLSLVAVLGIVTMGLDLVALRERWLPLHPWPLDRAPWRWLLSIGRGALDGLVIGIAATLATAPVLAWHFGTGNPWSPFTTLLAGPPSTCALWLGLPCLVLGGWFPGGPWEGLYRALEWCLDALVAVVDWGAAIPGATLHPGPPSMTTLLLWPLLFVPLRDGLDLALRAAMAAVLLLAW
jgi:ComEC/Rec2-related protein